ncbi:hypothetical protein KUCAC02_025717 [Chaenocephalus aceratus]|uniref:Uncharacterized protein n=1 Tax=Chaenocephalus aceratus TaxID=36190 RepID=A0ACB9VVC0_CHAAC|nr:hypothetical protein KUCAC02_025717 [Chaenocephalus aceratus]
MKGSEKEGGEDEEVGSEGENEVEVEMEEIEGGGEAEEVGNEVEVEMGEVEGGGGGEEVREEGRKDAETGGIGWTKMRKRRSRDRRK